MKKTIFLSLLIGVFSLHGKTWVIEPTKKQLAQIILKREFTNEPRITIQNADSDRIRVEIYVVPACREVTPIMPLVSEVLDTRQVSEVAYSQKSDRFMVFVHNLDMKHSYSRLFCCPEGDYVFAEGQLVPSAGLRGAPAAVQSL